MGLWEKAKGMLSAKVEDYKKTQEKERGRRIADDAAYKSELERAEGRARKEWARKKASETAKGRYVKPSAFGGGGGRPADVGLPSLDLFGTSGGGGGSRRGGSRSRKRRGGYGGGSILDF